jgi:transcriptional regulator with XRE-family HTH domain
MLIGPRLRSLREHQKLSQGDIENRTGLLRCYVSRVENGHTIPSVETLERLARGLEMPLYHVLYDGDDPPSPPKDKNEGVTDWAAHGVGARFLTKLRAQLSQMCPNDRAVLMSVASHMATRRRTKSSK